MRRFLRLLLFLPPMLYILGGVRAAPFHADEADQLYKARDYVIYFVLHDPGQLAARPPIQIHSEAHLRILTGTTAAYLHGLILWHSGAVTLEDWPPAWYYPDSVAVNRAAGRWPDERVLWWGRLGSALLTALCVPLMAVITWRISGRWWAGMWAGWLFALNPVMLINGRRVMQEAALMFFSLLTVYLIMRYASRPSVRWAVVVGIAVGLATAAKLTGVILLLAFLTASLVLMLLHGSRPYTFPLIFLIAILLHLALTPVLWPNPIGNMRLATELRLDMLEGQTAVSPQRYDSSIEKGFGLAGVAFPQQIQYYESDDFAADAELAARIRDYERSLWPGIRLPFWVVLPLAFLGIVSLSLRTFSQDFFHKVSAVQPKWVYLVWVVSCGLILGLNTPLGWQRYYLPWIGALMPALGLGVDYLWVQGVRRLRKQ